MSCWSGGDPHSNDFFGKKWDQHWEGTYYAFKYGDFEMQTTVKYCRNPVSWSRGRRIGCNYELGIQLKKGQVLNVAGHTRKTCITLNGHCNSGKRQTFAGGLTLHCPSAHQCQIEHPDFSVNVKDMPPYNEFRITSRSAVASLWHPAGRLATAASARMTTSGRMVARLLTRARTAFQVVRTTP